MHKSRRLHSCQPCYTAVASPPGPATQSTYALELLRCAGYRFRMNAEQAQMKR